MTGSSLHNAGAVQRYLTPSIKVRPATERVTERWPHAVRRPRYPGRQMGVPAGPGPCRRPGYCSYRNGRQPGTPGLQSAHPDGRKARTAIFTGVFLGAVVVSSAWGSPAAEGILTDDIWARVDRLLRDADSPRLSIDCTDVMQRVSIVRGEDESLYLMTSIVAYPLGFASCEMAMLQARQLVDAAVAASDACDPGASRGCKVASVEFEIVTVEGEAFEILLYEPIRPGASRTG